MSEINDLYEEYEEPLYFNDKQVMLVGFDIYKFLKNICDNALTVGTDPDMTEGEMKAYKLAVSNVLSLLHQILNETIHAGCEEYHNIAVHVPGVEELTEFLTIEDILDELEKMEEK